MVYCQFGGCRHSTVYWSEWMVQASYCLLIRVDGAGILRSIVSSEVAGILRSIDQSAGCNLQCIDQSGGCRHSTIYWSEWWVLRVFGMVSAHSDRNGECSQCSPNSPFLGQLTASTFLCLRKERVGAVSNPQCGSQCVCTGSSLIETCLFLFHFFFNYSHGEKPPHHGPGGGVGMGAICLKKSLRQSWLSFRKKKIKTHKGTQRG